MKIFLIILLLSVGAFAQECRNDAGFIAPVRFTYPAKITDYSGQKIFFSISTKNTVFVSEMDTDAKTQFPAGFEKNFKDGLYFIFVCEDSPRVVAWVQKLRKSDIKLETRIDQEKRLSQLRKIKE